MKPNQAAIQELYPSKDGLDLEQMGKVIQLSKEFRQLKKENASESRFDEWRQSVKERFARDATRLLEETRIHVLGVEYIFQTERGGMDVVGR